ncbi:putative RING-H2 finger protein ATL21A [Cajanus cajan]|uniref:RING-type E3 ubiquitin transferase n=1 Tax=Cajanus cajan TaxID=3821 RepID=A0A151SV70_CAJCA|nr:putative RING-H2 finger protein ATL21A [Cajanus cajan]KYP58701.1 RING-H2 finger protein ATL1E [Cajanus cajan]
MAPSAMVCALCLFLFHLQTTRANKAVTCNSLRCGDVDIQFPFGLKGSSQSPRCWYYPNPTFQLSCLNATKTILTLPRFGNLIVNSIDYETQTIRVNDPNGCLPKRFLQKWNLSDSPFILNPMIYGTNPYNLTFLRCPSNVTDSSQFPLLPISCLSDNRNYSVVVSWSPPVVSSPMMSQRCELLTRALVPIPMMDMPMWPFWPDLNIDLQLVWTQPRECRDCAVTAQRCGFSKTLQLACFPRDSNKGLSRSARYGLAIGVGIPGLLCLIGVSCYICGKVRMLTERRGSRDFPVTISLEPVPFVMGLDGATIEKYPKTLIGESGRLLKPNDNTCAICLSEYEPKETLRSIPECNHYFHADCIDEWLKLNATCPLCRNSPDPSSTLSFSSFSPTSSLHSPHSSQ